MATAFETAPSRSRRGTERPAYTPLQMYLLDRLAELRRRRRELPPAFRDHPIGRLTSAAIAATLEECRWAGLSRETGQEGRSPRRNAS